MGLLPSDMLVVVIVMIQELYCGEYHFSGDEDEGNVESLTGLTLVSEPERDIIANTFPLVSSS